MVMRFNLVILHQTTLSIKTDFNDKNFFSHMITINKQQESASFKQQILYFEGILLQTLCFDLAVNHPYTTLIQTVKNIHISHSRIRPIEKSLTIDMADWTKAKSLAQASWDFLNNSLMTPLCVIYRPEVIAAAAFLISIVHWVIECSTDHQAASDPSLPPGLDKSWLRSEVYCHLNLPNISNDPASEGSSKAQEWWTCFKVENLQNVYGLSL
ncbi:hypothetical protein BY996DRAFT_4649792 [Phakopsora pachyrhizi]|nr:hypothetical protein BY996DRAFT_4649792 [Phakopsora pachyrhizi]